MEHIDLTDEQRRVLEVLSAVEQRQGGSREDEIAAAAGLDGATTREALSVLVREDLVRELSASPDRDLGPRYRVKDSVS